jgi:tetrahydromethanopterin S-methyltransferase subunit B
MNVNAVASVPEQAEGGGNEILENVRRVREQLGRLEKKVDALCWYLLPRSGVGSLESHSEMRDDKKVVESSEEEFKESVVVFLQFMEEDVDVLLRQVRSYRDLVDPDGTILIGDEDDK